MQQNKKSQGNNYLYLIIPLLISSFLFSCSKSSSSSSSTSSTPNSTNTLTLNASVASGTLSGSSINATNTSATEPLDSASVKVFNAITGAEYSCINDVAANQNALTDSEGNVNLEITDSCISASEQENIEVRFYKEQGDDIISVGIDVDATEVFSSGETVDVNPTTNITSSLRRAFIEKHSGSLAEFSNPEDTQYVTKHEELKVRVASFRSLINTKSLENPDITYPVKHTKPSNVSNLDDVVEQVGAATVDTMLTNLGVDDSNNVYTALKEEVFDFVANVQVLPNSEPEDILNLLDESGNALVLEYEFNSNVQLSSGFHLKPGYKPPHNPETPFEAPPGVVIHANYHNTIADVSMNMQTATGAVFKSGFTIRDEFKDTLPPSANYHNGVGIPNGAEIPRGAKFGTYDDNGILIEQYVADGSSQSFSFQTGSTIDINEFDFENNFPLDNTAGRLVFETVNELPLESELNITGTMPCDIRDFKTGYTIDNTYFDNVCADGIIYEEWEDNFDTAGGNFHYDKKVLEIIGKEGSTFKLKEEHKAHFDYDGSQTGRSQTIVYDENIIGKVKPGEQFWETADIARMESSVEFDNRIFDYVKPDFEIRQEHMSRVASDHNWKEEHQDVFGADVIINQDVLSNAAPGFKLKSELASQIDSGVILSSANIEKFAEGFKIPADKQAEMRRNIDIINEDVVGMFDGFEIIEEDLAKLEHITSDMVNYFADGVRIGQEHVGIIHELSNEMIAIIENTVDITNDLLDRAAHDFVIDNNVKNRFSEDMKMSQRHLEMVTGNISFCADDMKFFAEHTGEEAHNNIRLSPEDMGRYFSGCDGDQAVKITDSLDHLLQNTDYEEYISFLDNDNFDRSSHSEYHAGFDDHYWEEFEYAGSENACIVNAYEAADTTTSYGTAYASQSEKANFLTDLNSGHAQYIIDFEAFDVFTVRVENDSHPVDSNTVMSVSNNGGFAGSEINGIQEEADATKGFNSTVSGSKVFSVYPSETGTGNVKFDFSSPVSAIGLNISGLESEKREIKAKVRFADDTVEEHRLFKNTRGIGGNTFAGIILDSSNTNCLVKSISIEENYNGEPANKRDIYSVDDVIYTIPQSGLVILSATPNLKIQNIRYDHNHGIVYDHANIGSVNLPFSSEGFTAIFDYSITDLLSMDDDTDYKHIATKLINWSEYDNSNIYSVGGLTTVNSGLFLAPGSHVMTVCTAPEDVDGNELFAGSFDLDINDFCTEETLAVEQLSITEDKFDLIVEKIEIHPELKHIGLIKLRNIGNVAIDDSITDVRVKVTVNGVVTVYTLADLAVPGSGVYQSNTGQSVIRINLDRVNENNIIVQLDDTGILENEVTANNTYSRVLDVNKSSISENPFRIQDIQYRKETISTDNLLTKYIKHERIGSHQGKENVIQLSIIEKEGNDVHSTSDTLALDNDGVYFLSEDTGGWVQIFSIQDGKVFFDTNELDEQNDGTITYSNGSTFSYHKLYLLGGNPMMTDNLIPIEEDFAIYDYGTTVYDDAKIEFGDQL